MCTERAASEGGSLIVATVAAAAAAPHLLLLQHSQLLHRHVHVSKQVATISTIISTTCGQLS
jgi:hypothetical protein